MTAVNAAELAECVRKATETAAAFYDWLSQELGKSSLVGRPDDCNYCPVALFLKQFLMQTRLPAAVRVCYQRHHQRASWRGCLRSSHTALGCSV
jgi:hypothetical protein